MASEKIECKSMHLCSPSRSRSISMLSPVEWFTVQSGQFCVAYFSFPVLIFNPFGSIDELP